MPSLLGGLTEDERRRVRERDEIERTAGYYPHLDRPKSVPTRDYNGSSNCPEGGSHNFRYEGYSESIGHYYRCTRCKNRS